MLILIEALIILMLILIEALIILMLILGLILIILVLILVWFEYNVNINNNIILVIKLT